MTSKIKSYKSLKRLNRKSFWLFILIGLVILLLSLANWFLELKPRLVNETVTHMQIMSASRAQSIEAQFQNIKKSSDYSIIRNSINELLLLNDPSSGENLFIGVELEVDYDALPVKPDKLNITAGSTQCLQCIKTENPIYNRANGELIAIIKIYSNPVFYQRLVKDIGNQLVLALTGVLLIILIAWLLTNRLLRKLKEREENLTFEISERKLIEGKLHQIATYDQLTNLPNRYLLHSEFKQKLEEVQRYDNNLAVLFFDLDHFKTINDVYGHETGDILLQEVSKRISALIRSYDLLARFGGDEFVMIMPHLKNAAAVYPVVEKIIDSFAQDYDLGEVSVQITTSIGISIFPQDGDDPSTLLKNADMAMYRAKSEGRNCYHFFTQKMNEDLKHSQWIELNLKEAIEKDELQLYFQPQVNITSGKIDSCEALLRWPQSDGSFIGPDEFIPIAERTSLINDVGNWVYNKACHYQQQWQQKQLNPVRIDINLSGKDFVQNKVLDNLINAISSEEQKAHLIGIEITENILLKSNSQVMQLLTRLHNAKVHISIDDFGTGYSSLNYLKQFPVSCLKIDQAFVREAPNNEQDQIIMQAITAVGHGFGMTVTAEGVETDEHLKLIRNLGCDLAQGNFISVPLPADQFEAQYLNKH